VKLYASILYSPSTKSRWIRPFERKPKLNLIQPTWYEENWTASRRLGEQQSTPSRTTRQGAGWGGRAHYDVRVVSDGDAGEIAAIDRAIAELQKKRISLVEERFRTWSQVMASDCERVVPGKSKAEVKMEIKKIRPVSRATVQAEGRLVGSLNQVVAEVLSP